METPTKIYLVFYSDYDSSEVITAYYDKEDALIKVGQINFERSDIGINGIQAYILEVVISDPVERKPNYELINGVHIKNNRKTESLQLYCPKDFKLKKLEYYKDEVTYLARDMETYQAYITAIDNKKQALEEEMNKFIEELSI